MKFLLLFLISFNASAFLTKNWLIEVNKGDIEGHEIIHKFGDNDLVGTSFVPVADSGIYQTPSTLQSLEIISSSANDTSAGSGARTVTVYGINDTNGSWTRDNETVTLNGTTLVALTKQWYRIFRIRVDTSGTYANATATSHNSTITLRGAGVGATWGTVNSDSGFGLGTSQIGVYTIPKGYTGAVIAKHVSVDANKPATIMFYARENADTISAPFSPMRVLSINHEVTAGVDDDSTPGGSLIVGPADVGFMAKLASGTGSIGAEFEMIIYKTPE